MKASDSFTALLDRSPVRTAQIAIVALILAALIIDGLDVQILALVAPVIIKEWVTTKASFGPALAAALAGMAAGSVAGGWLGDKVGRRMVLLLSTALFGTVTLLAGWAEGTGHLALLRLISGLGFGAAMPNGMALASEWMPPRLRPRVISILAIGIPLGGMIGAPLTLTLMPAYGWRGCFMACGAFTLLVALAMVKGIPESPAFLFARGRFHEAERTISRVVGHGLDTWQDERILEKRLEQGKLLEGRNLRMNIGVWLSFFCVAAFTYAIAGWGPVLFSGNGFTLGDAIRASFFHNAAAIAAALFSSLLLHRCGSRRLLLVGLSLTIFSILGIAGLLSAGSTQHSPDARLAVIGLMGAAGATSGLCTATIYTLLSLGYPLAYRTTGIGTGIMVGRLGAITMIALGGKLLDLRSDGLHFLITLVVGLALAVTGVLLVDRHIAPRLRTQ